MPQETIQWNKLTPEERNRVVAQKVMGLQEKACDGPSHGKIRRDSDPLNTLKPPQGLWHCSQCGHLGSGDFTSYEHIESSVIDDYSTSMSAAWRVLQKIAARWDEKDEYLDEVFYQFQHELLQDAGGEIWTSYELMARMAKWTPETICIAALKAYGYHFAEDEEG